jgi:hypothetical protein
MSSVPGSLRRLPGLLLLLLSVPGLAATVPDDSAGIAFFEAKIRPVLADHCYKCHSQKSEKVRGGLLLDSKDALRQGGDSGPAIVPGHPERSLLIRAVSYVDKDLQMPPKDQKLAENQIQDLRAWVRMGAPDPRTANAPVTNAVAWAAARRHWAFQKIVQPAVPKIARDKNWAKTPLDAFILENLHARGLRPSPPADKRTLLRRATFDLTGLPPTPQEVNAFLGDKSKNAFARVVDRLLASPRYGERWGRYWLDVARYADTKGLVNNQDSSRLPYAYTYRDYVIRSFNEDLPYDRFIVEQTAADQLPTDPRDNRRLAALGFLTVGRQFFGNENEMIDDKIDVVSRGLLALTVSCARCHDHKFDPIPTRDYYSLHGIFNSSDTPTNLPLLTVPLPAGYTNYLEDRRTNEAALDAYVSSNAAVVLAKVRSQTGDYLLATHDTAAFSSNSFKVEELLRARALNTFVFKRWRMHLPGLEKTNGNLFAPWFAFARLTTPEWRESAPKLARAFSNDTAVQPLVAELFKGQAPTNLAEVAARYDKLFAQIPTNAETDGSGAELRRFAFAPDSPAHPDPTNFVRFFLFDQPTIGKIRTLERKCVDVDATDPGAPPRAMVLRDKPRPANSHIFLRGDPTSRGAEAPREFLQVLSPAAPVPFPQSSSGRLQLAEDIASPDNPLTARVFVNRVWLHHFGAPLVATPSDFGIRTPRPLQAGALDYLAARFMAEGWSVKKLHRMIMLSAVYQQSSEDNPAAARIDPGNDYYWRMNPQRLDFEAMRDSLLFVTGQLDERMGGQPVDLTSNLFPGRRTVYGEVDRANLPGFFRTFDFASPDTTSAGRFETIVAPQALFLMNSPFLVECSRRLAQRCQVEGSSGVDARIRAMYECLYQRPATPEEIALGRDYLAHQPERDAVVPEPSAWAYGWGTFNDQTSRIESFQPLPSFMGSIWRPQKYDAKTGALQLSATGGNVGRTNYVVVRRWYAPRDGVISISGQFTNGQTAGLGVRGRIVSSRLGLLGQWTAHHNRVDASVEKIEVEKDDTIDFAVDSLDGRSGSFQWAPVIRMARVPHEEMGLPDVWDAKENFVDPRKVHPPLGPWEKYAQVLLYANEFFFID